MSRQFVSIDRNAPLETVIDQFVLHQVPYLPVLDQGRLVGVIGRRDVLRAVFSSDQPSVTAFSRN